MASKPEPKPYAFEQPFEGNWHEDGKGSRHRLGMSREKYMEKFDAIDWSVKAPGQKSYIKKKG